MSDNYYWDHVPRCLNNFNTEKEQIKETIFDGHGEELGTKFLIKCICGSSDAKIEGYLWKNPGYNDIEVFISPIQYICNTCNRSELLIDTAIHGYDSETENGSCTARAEGIKGLYKCEKCKSGVFTIKTVFSYPDDLFEEEYKEYKGKQQDLFSWFYLIGVCKNCGFENNITDFECA